jgi:hypothetical protein
MKSPLLIASLICMTIAFAMTACTKDEATPIAEINFSGKWQLVSTEINGESKLSPQGTAQIYSFDKNRIEKTSDTPTVIGTSITNQNITISKLETAEFEMVGINLFHIKGDSADTHYRLLDLVNEGDLQILRIQKTSGNDVKTLRLSKITDDMYAKSKVELLNPNSANISFNAELSADEKPIQVQTSSGSVGDSCSLIRKESEPEINPLKLKTRNILQAVTDQGQRQLRFELDSDVFELAKSEEPVKVHTIRLLESNSDQTMTEVTAFNEGECAMTATRKADRLEINFECDQDKVSSLKGAVNCRPVRTL